MKICVVSGNMTKDRIRMQPQCFIYNICRCLMKCNVSVRLMTDGLGVESKNDNIEGIAVRRFKSIRLPFAIGNRPLSDALANENPDAIFWHIGLTSFLHLNLIDVSKVPMIGIFTSPFYNLRDFLTPGLKNALSGFHDLWTGLLGKLIPSILIRKSAGTFQSIIVLSKAAMNGLIKCGIPAEKIRLIPPAIDGAWKLSFSENDKNRERRNLDLEPDDFIVVYFGSPIAYRGSHTLIESVSNSIGSIPNLKLLMLSRRKEGELTREQRQIDKLISRKGLSKRVRMISDFMPQERLIRLIALSDTVALPFEIAPSDVPLSILEAMALGKPVISTRVDGIPEYLSDNRGFLVDPGKPEQLSHALSEIYKDPDNARRFGENAKKYIERMPLWDAIAQNINADVLTKLNSCSYEDN